jgi:putative transcriptional regulator
MKAKVNVIRFLMELRELIRGARALVEAREKRSINQTEMAGRLGIGYRTYLEYERGTNAPLAMKALLNLLSLLDDQEVVRVVREWEQHKEVANEQHQ